MRHKSSILATCCQAPLERSVFLQTQASSPVSQPWQLRLELRCTESALPGKSRGEFWIIIIVLRS